MMTLLFLLYTRWTKRRSLLCSSCVFSCLWSHALSELSMSELLDVLSVVFQEKWMNNSEYAKSLIASGQRANVQRIKCLWSMPSTAASVLDGVRTSADASHDKNSLESSERSIPSTPTEYKSDLDDDWAGEQERMRALCRYERRHSLEWSMPSTPTEYKSDLDDDWAAEQERMRAECGYECRHFLDWSMPSTPTQYKSDLEDDWAAEQEGMRALYECRHPLEWLMPWTTTEYKFDSEDDWTLEEERRKAMELHRWHQRLAANGNCVECWCCRSMPSTSTGYKFDWEDDLTLEEERRKAMELHRWH